MRILIIFVLLMCCCVPVDEVRHIPKIIYKGYANGQPVWGHDTNGDGRIDYCAQYTYDEYLKEIARWESKDGQTCNR